MDLGSAVGAAAGDVDEERRVAGRDGDDGEEEEGLGVGQGWEVRGEEEVGWEERV